MHHEADEIKGSYDHGLAAGRAENAAEIERLRALVQIALDGMNGDEDGPALACAEIEKKVRAYQQRTNKEPKDA